MRGLWILLDRRDAFLWSPPTSVTSPCCPNNDQRGGTMIRTVILGGVLLGLALPAVARAGDDPTSTDRVNAAQ